MPGILLTFVSMNYMGIVIGVSTFLIIGLFHPIVIKSEYYFGKRCWWVFLLAGLAAAAGSLFVADIVVSTLMGVTAFSCFWSILELYETGEKGGQGLVPPQSEAETIVR